MKKINLTKYGFVRCPEEDFSDDGNRFTCFKVGRVRVSKLVTDGDAYISARIDNGKLDYEEYSKLTNYKDLDKLNGVSAGNITDQDLIDLYNTCVNYDKEYTELENKIQLPTLREIKDKLNKITELRRTELNTIISKASIDKVLVLSDYELKRFKDYYNTLKKSVDDSSMNERAQNIYGGNYSRIFIKNNYDLKPSWYYTELLKMLSK